MNSGLPSTYLSDIRSIGTDLFATSVFRGVFRLPVNSANWTNVSESTGGPLGTTDQLNAMTTISSKLYVSYQQSVHQTSTSGGSWTKGGPGIIDGFYPNLTSVVSTSDNTLFAGSSKGVFLSTNGVNWTLTSLTSDIRSLYSSGTEVYALTWSGNIFRSVNSGVTWTNISVLPILNINYAFTIVKVGGSLFAGTNGNGVYRSSDNGATWLALNEGLSNKYITYVTVIGDTFFAGAEDAGLYSRPLSELNDLTSPVITNTTVSSVANGAPVTIEATMTDPENTVNEYFIEYRNLATGSAGGLTKKDLTKNGNTYSSPVSADEIGQLGLEYRITASSFGGTNTTEFKTIKVDYPDGLTVPYSSFGTDLSNYRIVAVPLVLEKNKVSEVFDELGVEDNKKWRMYRYDEGNARTRQWSSSDKINPGLGYWLIVGDEANLNTNGSSKEITSGAGTAVTSSSDSPFEIQLKNGWNQIGNPYNYDLKWSDVQDANSGLPGLTIWTGSYIPAATLKKMEGGLVRVNADMKLKFPTKSASGSRVGGDPRPINYALNSISWEVPLLVRQGDQVNKISGIGMNEKASDGFDPYDMFNMPRFFDRYLELHHTKKDGSDIYSNDVVPRSDQYEWEFRSSLTFSILLIVLKGKFLL